MPILEDFCQAFQQAINQHVIERGEKISVERKNQIVNLRTYLNQCQNSDMNALRLREEMIERVQNLPFEFLEFLLGSRLSKSLEKVLKLPRFNEVQLMIAQCIEMQNTHQVQIGEKNTQINTLAEQVTTLTSQINQLVDNLRQESAKDSVQKVNQLTQELLTEKENAAYLHSTYEKLLTAHEALQEKYNALLKQSEKPQASQQDGKPNPHDSHFKFNGN